MRWRRWLIGGIVSVTIGTVLAFFLAHGGPIRACSTVAHLYIGPVEVQAVPGVDSLAACMGPNCTPMDVPHEKDGVWLVPQDAPYLQGDDELRGNLHEITIRAQARGTVLADGNFEVERVRLPGSEWPECPGRYGYKPITIR
ncbi:hypothetical protein [Georgenia ruanii]|uniref:hypothetical protein n=1 Tax=Georgenia ruanii TaxID=348442 RepID=UPI00126577C1|nr:hypothetical protein [Georgenia ruanii]